VRTLSSILIVLIMCFPVSIPAATSSFDPIISFVKANPELAKSYNFMDELMPVAESALDRALENLPTLSLEEAATHPAYKPLRLEIQQFFLKLYDLYSAGNLSAGTSYILLSEYSRFLILLNEDPNLTGGLSGLVRPRMTSNLDLLIRLADLDVPIARKELARAFRYGKRGLDRNLEMALQYHITECDNGYSDSCVQAASIFDNDDYTKRNPFKSEEFYERALAAGNYDIFTPAGTVEMLALGFSGIKGNYPKNQLKAYFWRVVYSSLSAKDWSFEEEFNSTLLLSPDQAIEIEKQAEEWLRSYYSSQ